MQDVILELKGMGKMPDEGDINDTDEIIEIYKRIVAQCPSNEWCTTLHNRLNNWINNNQDLKKN